MSHSKRNYYLDHVAKLDSLYTEEFAKLGLPLAKPLILSCPSCQTEFWINPPPMRPSWCHLGEMTLACPLPCGYWGTLREFHPKIESDNAKTLFDKVEHCPSCGFDFAVNGVIYRRPCCAIETPREAINTVAKSIKTAAAKNEKISRDELEVMLARLVSTFDGVMRSAVEISKSNYQAFSKSGMSTPPYPWFQELPDIHSFQNLESARKKLLTVGYDIGEHSNWNALVLLFQKRHLCTHKLGVVDSDYLNKTGDTTAKLGKLVPLDIQEIVTCASTCVDIVNDFFGYWLS